MSESDKPVQLVTPVVAVVIAAVAYAYAGVGMGVGAWVLFAIQVAVSVDGEEYEEHKDFIGPVLSNIEPVMKIWTDNDKVLYPDIFCDEVIEKQVESMINVLIADFPNIDQEAVSNVLRINLQGYYGIRK